MTPEIRGLGLTPAPTQNELPYDDGVPMESQRHKLQMELLIDGIDPWLETRDNGYVGGNMFVYFNIKQLKNQDFRGPDFFAVLNVPKGERRSWVCWEEGKPPDVVIELLSDSTRNADKTEKKQIYETQLRVPEYFWYDPFDPEDWAGFRLQGGDYQEIELDAENRFISEALGLALVRWHGVYKTVEAVWLRWASIHGRLLPTSEERIESQREQTEQERQRAEQERQRAEQERQRAEQEQQRADRAEAQIMQIARSLLDAGMTIDQVAQTTGLQPAQLER